MKSELNNFGLGRLTLLADDSDVDYQPYEVSRFGLGIIAREDMEPGSELLLTSPSGPVRFCILAVMPHELFSAQARYTLSVVDGHTDIEELLHNTGCFQRIAAEASKSEFRNARFEIKPTIRLNAKTFGARGEYLLTTVNVSKSGLLAATEVDSPVPFIVNTLLELKIDPESQWLDPVITCLGKVVRHNKVEKAGQRIQYFGIQFIEFTGQAQVLWQKALEEIERQNAESKLSQLRKEETKSPLAG